MKGNLERYDEIAIKLLKVGEALIMEGEDKGDYTILNIGNFIIFVSSLLYDESDIHLFSELCSMMAAKKMVDESEMMNLLSDLSFQELEGLIKMLKDKRG